MVARKLNAKIRDHLLNATRTGVSLFTGESAGGVGALGRPGEISYILSFLSYLLNDGD